MGSSHAEIHWTTCSLLKGILPGDPSWEYPQKIKGEISISLLVLSRVP